MDETPATNLVLGLRAAVFVSVAAFVALGPAYRQVWGGSSELVRAWRMFRGNAVALRAIPKPPSAPRSVTTRRAARHRCCRSAHFTTYAHSHLPVSSRAPCFTWIQRCKILSTSCSSVSADRLHPASVHVVTQPRYFQALAEPQSENHLMLTAHAIAE